MIEPELMGVSPLDLYKADLFPGPSVPALERAKGECERLRLLAVPVVAGSMAEREMFTELLERAEKVRSEIEGEK